MRLLLAWRGMALLSRASANAGLTAKSNTLAQTSFHFALSCENGCPSSQVVEETLHHRGTTLVRRLLLAPGEATRWHRDPCHRITVVFQGAALTIELRDGRHQKHVTV